MSNTLDPMLTRSKFLTCLAAVLAVGAISTSATASAATTFGHSCIGNSTTGSTATQLSLVTPVLPLTAPQSGVITSWSTAVIPYGGGISEKIKVLRPTGPANTFQTVAESKLEPVVSGVNNFPARVPIQAGDKIAAFGSPATLICTGGAAGDVIGVVAGDQAPGTTAAYTPTPSVFVPLTATIETDADNDGFGDESQDKCPQNALFQDPCPPLLVEAAALSPNKGSVRILVASSLETNITVSASAKLAGKSKKAKSSATTTKLASITQLVKPGQLASYTLNFTKALKKELAALSSKKSVKLAVVVEGKSAAGTPGTDTLTVKLKGQAKPK